MMDLMQLLGNKLLWAGTADSLTSVAFSLLPEQFDVVMRAAILERQEWNEKRSRAQALRADRLKSVQSAMGAAMTGSTLKIQFGEDDDEEDEDRYAFHSATYRTEGSTAVIGIKGALVNSDKWYLRYFGQVGYPHITDQLMRAYNDPAVTSVVLDMNSPGGAVNGVGQTSEIIQALSTHKPVTVFADGLLCSGGYWLASAAEHITVTDLTEVGSIGVIMTHIEYSKALEKAGITPTVLREGRYKALMSSYEPLSDEAKAQARHSMSVIYEAFLNHVAEGRKVTKEHADQVMGQGRTFWGAEGVGVNLVDTVGDISRAVAFSRHLADTRAGTATFSH